MRSEYARIIGNYLRLLIGFAIGLLMVRQLLHYGADIFNIFTIVTVGAGIGIMLRELLRIALTSHLSKAWAGRGSPDGDQHFREVYGQAMALSAIACLLGLALMAGLALAVAKLDIAAENVGAARAFIASRAAIMAVTVVMSPLLTMVLVLQKFGRMNTLMTLERLSDFLAVLSPLVLLAPGFDGASALAIFALVSAVLTGSLYLYAGWRVVWNAPELLRPTWHWGGRDTRQAIMHSVLWAFALVLSFNLFLRFDTFFINTHFGAMATIAFGLAVQLMGMVRQLTVGIVNGLDAVVARLAFDHSVDKEARLQGQRILALNSYLQTVLTLAAVMFLTVGARDVLHVWVGDRVHDPHVLTLTASLAAIMLAGVGARSLSEGWMATLNGQGAIGSYVRYTVIVTCLNPLLLLAGAAALGSSLPLQAVAWAFAVLLALSHLAIVPLVYVRETGQNPAALVRPLLRGLVATPVALALALAVSYWAAGTTSLTRMIAIAGAIGFAYGCDILLYAWRSHRHT